MTVCCTTWRQSQSLLIVLHCFVSAVFPHALESISSQAAQGGGQNLTPLGFLCRDSSGGPRSNCMCLGVQPPQPPTNFYPGRCCLSCLPNDEGPHIFFLERHCKQPRNFNFFEGQASILYTQFGFNQRSVECHQRAQTQSCRICNLCVAHCNCRSLFGLVGI